MNEYTENLEEALRKIACYLGVGGYNADSPIDPFIFTDEIISGIDDYLKIQFERGYKAAKNENL